MIRGKYCSEQVPAVRRRTTAVSIPYLVRTYFWYCIELTFSAVFHTVTGHIYTGSMQVLAAVRSYSMTRIRERAIKEGTCRNLLENKSSGVSSNLKNKNEKQTLGRFLRNNSLNDSGAGHLHTSRKKVHQQATGIYPASSMAFNTMIDFVGSSLTECILARTFSYIKRGERRARDRELSLLEPQSRFGGKLLGI